MVECSRGNCRKSSESSIIEETGRAPVLLLENYICNDKLYKNINLANSTVCMGHHLTEPKICAVLTQKQSASFI